MEYSSASSSMPLRRHQLAARRRSTGTRPGLVAFQLRQQHVAEQVMVAEPLAPLVQRHQQQIGPGQILQRRRGPGPVQHRLAQRPAHPLQHRGPGQEHPLPPGDPGQELRLHILAHQPVATAGGDRRAAGRAAFPEALAPRDTARPATPRSAGAAPPPPPHPAPPQPRAAAQTPPRRSATGHRGRSPESCPRRAAAPSAAAARPGRRTPAASRAAHDRPAPTARPGIRSCAARAHHPRRAPPASVIAGNAAPSRGTTSRAPSSPGRRVRRTPARRPAGTASSASAI